ncbi:MAG: 1-(5-phosphoribosyl)-5-[(5-phosphoribosylamino)methylideneamino]imidazole-4-carboxamide isomerase [Spirochaetes bacterium]|nr:1-(5-phosphoribosyl)-5-[(5-phosphoribosylamino)methylideneamino]imidazole-4-carboxamide isomerase [Spirochaetota bacterium]
MYIIPAIDLINGQCVRLIEGDFQKKSVYQQSPLEQAKIFEKMGTKRLHIVDLDGAKTGQSINRSIIKDIKQQTNLKIETGGGIRSDQDVEELISAGIDYVILGTLLVENFELTIKLAKKYPGQVIAGIDVKNNVIKVKGWLEGEALDPLEFGKKCYQNGISSAVFTDISRDGKLQGPNLDSTQKFAQCGLNIILSGGVTTIDDIHKAQEVLVHQLEGVIIGKAYYEGKIDLEKTLQNFS